MPEETAREPNPWDEIIQVPVHTSEEEWETASAEWEAQWEEFIRLAREYRWPEDYIQDYLKGHRVTYHERVESLGKIRELIREGNLEEALFENKRTEMRTPGNPADDPFRQAGKRQEGYVKRRGRKKLETNKQ